MLPGVHQTKRFSMCTQGQGGESFQGRHSKGSLAPYRRSLLQYAPQLRCLMTYRLIFCVVPEYQMFLHAIGTPVCDLKLGEIIPGP